MSASDAPQATHWVNGTQQLDGCRLHTMCHHGSLVAPTHQTVGLEVTASGNLVKPLLQFWQQIYAGLRTQACGKGIFGLLQGCYYCTGIRVCVLCAYMMLFTCAA